MTQPSNEYREILCLWFPSGKKVILDSAKYPTDQVFLVGRYAPSLAERSTCIYFDSQFVSARQAEIRYSPGPTANECFWEIRHLPSKGGAVTHTFLNSERLPAFKWVMIREYDKATFSVRENWIRFSYILTPTLDSPVVEEVTIGTKALPEGKDNIPTTQFWQVASIKIIFDEMQETPVGKLVVIIFGILAGLALFLTLGFALK